MGGKNIKYVMEPCVGHEVEIGRHLDICRLAEVLQLGKAKIHFDLLTLRGQNKVGLTNGAPRTLSAWR